MSVKGFDISSNNGPLSAEFFRRAFKEGYRFVFIKLTEGTNYTNPYAAQHAKWARDAGLIPGAYAFVSPKSGRSPVQEADYFASKSRDAGLLKQGSLAPAPDLEVTKLPVGRPSRRYDYRFIERLQNHYGILHPFLYTASWFWDGILNARNSHDCPLWLAAYVPNWRKLIPKGFKKVTIHQSTDKGHIGSQGPFDIDTYLGTLDQLKKYHTLKRDH